MEIERVSDMRDDLRMFLQSALAHPFPAPGERVRLILPAEKDRYPFTLPDNLVRPTESESGLMHVRARALRAARAATPRKRSGIDQGPAGGGGRRSPNPGRLLGTVHAVRRDGHLAHVCRDSVRAARAVHLVAPEPTLRLHPRGHPSRPSVRVAGTVPSVPPLRRRKASSGNARCADALDRVPCRFPRCRRTRAPQHVFIPILPKSLIDYVLAPMPYVIGVDRSHTAELERASASMSEVGHIAQARARRHRLV